MASNPKRVKIGVVEATAPDFPVTVMIDKDMADRISMGDEITVVLSGTIRGIRDNAYSPQVSGKIAVDIGNVQVSTTGLTPADSELKRLMDAR